MKRLMNLLLAGAVTALVLAAVFAGSALSSGQKGDGGRGDSNASETTLEVYPNPVTEGDIAIFTATVTYRRLGTPIADATVDLQQLQLPDGTPAQVGTPGADWVTIDRQTTDANGKATFYFDTSGHGGRTIGFRAKTDRDPTNWSESQSPAIDLQIVPGCTGVQIAATLAAGNGSPPPGYTGCWKFRITVKNCSLSTRVFKVQGGSNGWANIFQVFASQVDPGYSPNPEVRSNRRNEVITWWVELDPGEEQYIDVTMCGTIKPSTPIGTVLYLSGAWSAAYVDDDGNPAKSDYTGRVSLTVSGPSP